jgi:hypothetical protein
MIICFAFFPVSGFPPSQFVLQQPDPTLQQSGITGRVYLLEGNQMPSPRRRWRIADSSFADKSADSHSVDKGSPDSLSRALPQAKGVGVAATVCVFALTNDSQVIRQGTGPYCQTINSRLIRQVKTDDNGNFSILLPPGTYSVFTKKGDLFYATRRDEKNNIAPVEVLPGKMTRVDCRVESDHKVVY